jgi:hypothetical protein
MLPEKSVSAPDRAAQLALFLGGGAPLGKARNVGAAQSLVQDLFELAAVVREGEAGLERHRFGWNEVATAQFHRVDSGLPGGEIDEPFDHVGGFRAAVAAIGPHRIRVRVDGRDVGMDRGRAIDACERAEIVQEVRRAGLEVRAHVGDGLHPHADERAVLVERKLRVGHVVACFGVAEKSFRAGAQPLHWPASELGGEQCERGFIEDR